MALCVRQPAGVSLRRVVARLTAPHRALAFRRHVVLGTFATCKVVIRALQVFADIQPARIIKEVGGAVGACLLRVGRVVEGIMTVRALKLAFGVHVPGTAELVLARNVQAGVGDALGTVHLTGRCRLGVARLVGKVTNDQRLLEVGVHRAVTLAAVFVGRILDLEPGFLEATFGVKRLLIPLPPRDGFCHQACAEQRWRSRHHQTGQRRQSQHARHCLGRGDGRGNSSSPAFRKHSSPRLRAAPCAG